MTDIVERLRDLSDLCKPHPIGDLSNGLDEAADYIETLRTRVDEYILECNRLQGACHDSLNDYVKLLDVRKDLEAKVAEQDRIIQILRWDIDGLRNFAGEIYQVLGALGAPAHVLDRASAAAQGEPLTGESLLPFMLGRNGLEAPQNAALREAVEYLDRSSMNSICSGSILHRQMRDALTAAPTAPAEAEGDFTAWWKAPEQSELRTSCAQGWAEYVWQARAQLGAVPEHNGWYCAQCERGVDPSEVTYNEAHTECGRIITNDRPPALTATGWRGAVVAVTPAMEAAAEKYWNERRFKGLSDDPRTWKGVIGAALAAAQPAQEQQL